MFTRKALGLVIVSSVLCSTTIFAANDFSAITRFMHAGDCTPQYSGPVLHVNSASGASLIHIDAVKMCAGPSQPTGDAHCSGGTGTVTMPVGAQNGYWCPADMIQEYKGFMGADYKPGTDMCETINYYQDDGKGSPVATPVTAAVCYKAPNYSSVTPTVVTLNFN